MMIVDSQVHIWAADTPERPWPPGQAARAHQPTPLTAEDLLEKMDAAGVARAILVPPSWEGDRNDVVLALAKRPNIAVKASAVTDYSSEPYPFPILHGYLRQVFDAFGPKRMFWGSDISRVRHTYQQMITLFTEELSWLGEDDKAWIMGRGLC